MSQVHPFLLPGGIVLGLIFSATTAAIPVWLAQVTTQRGCVTGCRVALILAIVQAFWALIAGALLFSMGPAYEPVSPGFRAGAVAVLIYMGVVVVRSPRLEFLFVSDELPADLVSYTLRRAFWMPMRLPGFLALIIAVNLPLRISGTPNAVLLATGIGIGCFAWGIFFAAVSWFGRNVPEAICVRSLNKLRTLSALVLFALALIAFAPFLFRV